MYQKLTSIIKYIKNKEVSFAQAVIKHYIVPQDVLVKNIPSDAVVLDIGCGEGILLNVVGYMLSKSKCIGIDIDRKKIDIAKRNANQNVEFRCQNFFDLDSDFKVDVVIMNDFVHHFSYSKQLELMDNVVRRIKPGGKLFLKEVDQLDKLDRGVTTFFDKKLYPNDDLSYRTKDEWLVFLKRLGITNVKVEKIKKMWPASNTLLIAKLPLDRDVGYVDNTKKIQERTLAARKNKLKTVFVTGATGFIGKYVIDYLLEKGMAGNSVSLVLLTRNMDNIPKKYLHNENIEWLVGDLHDMEPLKECLVEIDYVFHLAAEVKFFKGADVWKNNYYGTLCLLEALKEVKIERFVFASTIGAFDRLPSDSCTQPLDEKAEPNPLSEYGKSKLEAERAVRNSGLNYTIVRIPWAYGKGMTPDTHVRNLMQAVYQKKIATWFNFPGKVSIVAARDLARAFIFLAENKKALNEIYFVTDGQPVSLGDLFKLMGDIIGTKAGFINIPKIITKIAQRLRRFFPLVIQNLNSDVLTATNEKVFNVGFQIETSKREGLQILAEDVGILSSVLRENEKLITIVTGAASGIGKALASKLSELGHRLLLIDVQKINVENFSNQVRVDFLNLDLTKVESLNFIADYLQKNKYVVDWVFNNAGIGIRGEFAELKFEAQKKVIDLNCVVPTFLSHLALNHFKKFNRGRIINIASSSAVQPLPLMSVYAASKSYIKSFTESITGEMLAKKNIRITTVIPSGTDTGFQKASGVKKNENEKLMSAEEVSRKIIDAVFKNKNIVYVGFLGKIMAILANILPINWQIKLWYTLMKKMR
ncbi:SDR family NAD(P)-dependent oxidoreductase [bacterium]|jgi:uncharacterized protein|nr:SDR family NAD(P)-dependent oxidoreductase [bacterium]MBT3581957.1 SDR family NAD(P)-dependent oxidoreductase [bacterium]MBT4551690.1 SDR family NAD(P)-dependent oxidoreductase [bacterium]MBT7088511.1 SDR family NAD(P)-dependent oxidoreductase [bacterium]